MVIYVCNNIGTTLGTVFLPKLSDYIVIKEQNWSYFVVLSFMNDQDKLGIPASYVFKKHHSTNMS